MYSRGGTVFVEFKAKVFDDINRLSPADRALLKDVTAACVFASRRQLGVTERRHRKAQHALTLQELILG